MPLVAWVEVTTYPDERRACWCVHVDGVEQGAGAILGAHDGAQAFTAAMQFTNARGYQLGGWTHRVLEKAADGQQHLIAPTRRTTSPLCGASRGWMHCVRDAGHEGDHETIDMQTGTVARWGR